MGNKNTQETKAKLAMEFVRQFETSTKDSYFACTDSEVEADDIKVKLALISVFGGYAVIDRYSHGTYAQLRIRQYA